MTELDRHRRAQDLGVVIRALESYRDQDAGLELDLHEIPGFHDTDVKGRRRLVLARLRERLFEISRRNRLLFHRPTLQTLNLTFASVPILFDLRSIRPEQLFTWQPEVRAAAWRRRRDPAQPLPALRGCAVPAGRARQARLGGAARHRRVRLLPAAAGGLLPALARTSRRSRSRAHRLAAAAASGRARRARRACATRTC